MHASDYIRAKIFTLHGAGNAVSANIQQACNASALLFLSMQLESSLIGRAR